MIPTRAQIEEKIKADGSFRDILEENTDFFGIRTIRGKKLAFDDGDKTPSVHIYAGNLVSYNNGRKSYDLVDLVAKGAGLNLNNNKDFIKALKEAAILAGFKMSGKSFIVKKEYKQKKRRVEYAPALPKGTVEIWENNRMKYSHIYKLISNELMRNLTDPEKDYATKRLRLGLEFNTITSKKTGKTWTEKRVTIPEFEEDGETLHNYAGYNRKSAIKCKKRDTGPDEERVAKPGLVGAHFVKNFNKETPIMWMEGHPDVVHATGLGLQAVTAGSSSTPITQFLHIFKGREIHFFPDNDKAGATGVASWLIEVAEYNKSLSPEDKIKVKVMWWSLKTLPKAKKELGEKIIAYIKKTMKINGIPENITETDAGLEKIKKYANESGLFPSEYWEYKSVIADKILDKGFDFTDFVGEYRNHKNFSKFISKYKI